MKLNHPAILACGLAFLAGGAIHGDDEPHRSNAATLTYKVTIENLAPTQPLSPPVLATHKQPVGMFSVGRIASPGLEAIAEDGNQVPMFMRLDGLRHVTDAVDVGVPLTPNGQTVMDFTDSVTVMIHGRPSDRLSMATMLICTNDGFTGLDHARLPLFGSRVYLTAGYDAGTEDNSELSMDIVDPCSALGPVTLDGDPNGNENEPVDTQPREPIRHHPGIAEIGDLLAAHGWTDPVAKVTVTRVDRDARAFLAPLSGSGEEPPVDSTAHGQARMRLARDGDSVILGYRLEVFDLVDAAQAHIHLGSPDENGPVVAFLFGPQDPAGLFNGTLAEGRIEESDLRGPLEGDLMGFIQALRAGELYVNVHTAAHPGGEIRGQIGAADGIGRARRHDHDRGATRGLSR